MLEKAIQLSIPGEKLDLLAHYFSDVRVFIYGSCTNTPPEQSEDVDLVVVSTSFSGVVGIKRKQLVCRLLATPSLRVDPICLTPRELECVSGSESLYALFLKEQIIEIARMPKDD
jgi:stress-induced morphogen